MSAQAADLDALPPAWPHRDRSRFVEVGGLRWHLQHFEGAEPQLLLLHGTASSSHSWAKLAPLLAPSWSVVAPDLPGHGFSSSRPEALSLPGMARAVATLLERLELRPRLVVGHSAGAAVLLRMALDGLLDPAAVVSINGALLPLPGLMGRVFPAAARCLDRLPGLSRLISFSARRDSVMDGFVEQTGSAGDAIELECYRFLARRPGHVRAALGMMAAWDLEMLEGDLAGLSLPLHLIACGNDRAVPPAQARFLSGRLSCASLHSVAGLGHLGHEEDPQRFAALLGTIALQHGLPGFEPGA